MTVSGSTGRWGSDTGTSEAIAHRIAEDATIRGFSTTVERCVEHPRDRTSAITDDTAERVAKFLHAFLLPHAVAFYSSAVGMSDDQDRLEDLAGCILAHKLETVTFRDVARYVRSMKKLKRAEVTAILEQLDALGWLTQIPGPRAGSPSQWRVNPECRRLFGERAANETERRKKACAAMNEAFAKVKR